MINLFFIHICLAFFFTHDYGNYSSKLIDAHLNYASQHEKLSCIGKGGSMASDIKILDFCYISPLQPDLGEARKIYVRVATDLIKRFNADLQIRPYLHDFPFTSKNIDIIIVFNNSSISVGQVTGMFLREDTIYYKVVNKNLKEDTFSESFDKAVSIVNGKENV